MRPARSPNSKVYVTFSRQSNLANRSHLVGPLIAYTIAKASHDPRLADAVLPYKEVRLWRGLFLHCEFVTCTLISTRHDRDVWKPILDSASSTQANVPRLKYMSPDSTIKPGRIISRMTGDYLFLTLLWTNSKHVPTIYYLMRSGETRCELT